MAKNPLIRSFPKRVNKPMPNKSAGILDDFAVRKNVCTKDGTIESTPVNDVDIANKKYVDDQAGSPERLVAHVKEANVSAVKKGQMCAIVGSSGSKFEVQLCDCDDKDLIRVIGLVQTDTLQNAAGTVIYKGKLEEVDTRPTNLDVNPNGETWLAGDMLFVSQTPGGLTKVRPTSGRCIKAGRTLKGSSVSDTLLAIVHTNAICSCAASGEDMCSRMGDSAGVNKYSFKDYANNEVGAMDSNGNFSLSGTVDGVDIAGRDHAESHTVASHSDTSATGAELNTLTDGSETALHSHAVTGYVHRGDPSAWDWTIATLTTDATWRDLDLSAIVPAGAKVVFLTVLLEDNLVGQQISFRNKDNSNNYIISRLRTQVTNVEMNGMILVACNSDRVIQYHANNTTYTKINIAVAGWWF